MQPRAPILSNRKRFRRLVTELAIAAAVITQSGLPALQELHVAAHALDCQGPSATFCTATATDVSLQSRPQDAAEGHRNGATCPVCQAASHSRSFTSPAADLLPGIAPSTTSVGFAPTLYLAAPVLAACGPRAPPAIS
jgi:hypothetical protein